MVILYKNQINVLLKAQHISSWLLKHRLWVWFLLCELSYLLVKLSYLFHYFWNKYQKIEIIKLSRGLQGFVGSISRRGGWIIDMALSSAVLRTEFVNISFLRFLRFICLPCFEQNKAWNYKKVFLVIRLSIKAIEAIKNQWYIEEKKIALRNYILYLQQFVDDEHLLTIPLRM